MSQPNQKRKVGRPKKGDVEEELSIEKRKMGRPRKVEAASAQQVEGRIGGHCDDKNMFSRSLRSGERREKFGICKISGVSWTLRQSQLKTATKTAVHFPSKTSKSCEKEKELVRMSPRTGLPVRLYTKRRISPRTGLPVRMYTKRSVAEAQPRNMNTRMQDMSRGGEDKRTQQTSSLVERKDRIRKKYKKLAAQSRLKSLRSAQENLVIPSTGGPRTLRSDKTQKEEQKSAGAQVKQKNLPDRKTNDKKDEDLFLTIKESEIPDCPKFQPFVELDRDDVILPAFLPEGEHKPLSREKRMLLRGCDPDHRCCQQRAGEMIDNCTQWEDPVLLYTMLSASCSEPPAQTSEGADTKAGDECGQTLVNRNLNQFDLQSPQGQPAFTLLQQSYHHLLQQQLLLVQSAPGLGSVPSQGVQDAGLVQPSTQGDLSPEGLLLQQLQAAASGLGQQDLLQQAVCGAKVGECSAQQLVCEGKEEKGCAKRKGRRRRYKKRTTHKSKSSAQLDKNVFGSAVDTSTYASSMLASGPSGLNGFINFSQNSRVPYSSELKDISLTEPHHYNHMGLQLDQNMQTSSLVSSPAVYGESELNLEPHDLEIPAEPQQDEGILDVLGSNSLNSQSVKHTKHAVKVGRVFSARKSMATRSKGHISSDIVVSCPVSYAPKQSTCAPPNSCKAVDISQASDQFGNPDSPDCGQVTSVPQILSVSSSPLWSQNKTALTSQVHDPKGSNACSPHQSQSVSSSKQLYETITWQSSRQTCPTPDVPRETPSSELPCPGSQSHRPSQQTAPAKSDHQMEIQSPKTESFTDNSLNYPEPSPNPLSGVLLDVVVLDSDSDVSV